MNIGQQVVCVDADFVLPRQLGQENYPIFNGVYTIRDIYEEPFVALGKYCGGPKVVVLLMEISNYPRNWMGGYRESGFAIARFRPLAEMRETSIACLTELLKTKLPQTEKV